MRLINPFMGMLIIFLIVINTAVFATTEENTTYHIILKMRDSNPVTQDRLNDLSKQLGLPIGLELIKPMAGNAFIVGLSNQQLPKVMQQSKLSKAQLLKNVLKLLNDKNANTQIKYASEDKIIRIHEPFPPNFVVPGFNYHNLQWDEFLPPGGVSLESAPGLKDLAWQITQGLSSIVVAVIDSGVDANLDLTPNVLPGWNFPAGTDDVADITTDCLTINECHGTHVAGTIAAIGSNGSYTNMPQGMGPNLKILPENVFTAGGSASESDIINAMFWAVGETVPGVPNNPNPAKVLNLSLGDASPCSLAFQDAISQIGNSAVIVVAAGNDDVDVSTFTPANCPGVIAVAATDFNGLRATYSNFGSGITLAAPGGTDNYSPDGILSTTGSDAFLYLTGTSMAAPHVAGIAGLIYSAAASNHMSVSPIQITSLLVANTNPFGVSSDTNINCSGAGPKACGSGIVNAFSALKALFAVKATFVGPSVSQLNLKNGSGIIMCANGFQIPALATGTQLPVTSNGYTAYWQIQSAACAASSVFLNPVISAGTPITLQYGDNNNQYIFVPPAGLTCVVTNSNSVQCN